MTSTTTLSPEFIAEYNAGKLMALSIAFIVIVTIFMVLRFYARFLSKATFGLDDHLALISWALSLGVSIISICFVIYGGLGRHFKVWQITDPTKIRTYFKYLLTVSTFYYLPVTISKLSILAFYNRIFVTKPYHLAILLISGVIIANAVVSIIVSLNLCHPFTYYWDQSVPGGHCYNQQAFFKWSGFPNIITDVAMILLPIPVIWKLQTSVSVKMGLTGIFATGMLGLVGSIVKFFSFNKFSAVTDGTWQSTDLMLWGSIEVYCYVIAACLVTFRPIITRIIRERKNHQKTMEERKTSDQSARFTGTRRVPPVILLSSGSRIRWTDEEGDDGRDDPNAPKERSLVTVEGGGRGPSEDSGLSSGKIYVSREWDVASSEI